MVLSDHNWLKKSTWTNQKQYTSYNTEKSIVNQESQLFNEIWNDFDLQVSGNKKTNIFSEIVKNNCMYRLKPILDNLDLNHIVMIHWNNFGKAV